MTMMIIDCFCRVYIFSNHTDDDGDGHDGNNADDDHDVNHAFFLKTKPFLAASSEP